MILFGYLEPIENNSYTIPVYKEPDSCQFYFHNLNNDFKIISFDKVKIDSDNILTFPLTQIIETDDFGVLVFVSTNDVFSGKADEVIKPIISHIMKLDGNKSVKEETMQLYHSLITNPEEKDGSVLCVVEHSIDILPISKAGEHKGGFYVLGGLLSPLDGIGPSELNIGRLFEKIKKNREIEEVHILLSPTIEGDTTLFYIYLKLKETNVKVTYIATDTLERTTLETSNNAALKRTLKERGVLIEDYL
jgi:recombinational DNA repair protein RecR